MELVESFPEACRYVLETLRSVYRNDALAREQGLDPEERLRLHQEQSGPLMNDLHQWMEAQFAERKTEPNSGLRKRGVRAAPSVQQARGIAPIPRPSHSAAAVSA